jgi:hypothetical protein
VYGGKNKKYLTVRRKRVLLAGWRRTNTGRTQAKTGGESNISLARTSICIKESVGDPFIVKN